MGLRVSSVELCVIKLKNISQNRDNYRMNYPVKVLTFTTLFPNNVQPNHGIFIMERMKRAADYCDLKVVAPVPFFPPLKMNSKWYSHSQVARKIQFPEFEVHYPRYFITPKIGMIFYGLFLFLSTIGMVRRINKKFNFDIIDAHYIYPEGLTAILLGKLFRKKVVLSARGTDINLYPKFPLIKKQIIYTLNKADKIISVCQALKDTMVKLGITPNKIKVVPNGVDINKFYPIDRNEARKRTQLPGKKKIILSVGHLIERKGFHFIIEALAILKRKNGSGNCPLLVIVGEGEYRISLEKQISDLSLESDVMLIGSKSHDQLNDWYNACDLFCLASSREGWPNVLFEALACGKPVVATNVWGVSEVLKSKHYGILVEKQDPLEISKALDEAMTIVWDEKSIIRYAQKHTWNSVGESVYRVFTDVMNNS